MIGVAVGITDDDSVGLTDNTTPAGEVVPTIAAEADGVATTLEVGVGKVDPTNSGEGNETELGAAETDPRRTDGVLVGEVVMVEVELSFGVCVAPRLSPGDGEIGCCRVL